MIQAVVHIMHTNMFTVLPTACTLKKPFMRHGCVVGEGFSVAIILSVSILNAKEVCN